MGSEMCIRDRTVVGALLFFRASRAPVCVDPPPSVIWSSHQHASDKPEGALFSAGEVPDGELRTFPKKQRILPSPDYASYIAVEYFEV